MQEIWKIVSAFEIHATMLTYPEFSTVLKIILAHLLKNAVSAIGGLAAASTALLEELRNFLSTFV